MTSNQSDLYEHLIQAVEYKSDLAKQYDAAEKLDDLILLAAERTCLAAYSIMNGLKAHKRGVLILRLMKVLHRSGYDDYWKTDNRLFSQCAIFVVAKLMESLHELEGLKEGNYFLEQMTTWTGVWWYRLVKMPISEIESFKTQMTEAIADHEDNPPSNDLESINRILNVLGRKPELHEIATLSQTLLASPLRLIEPIPFARNYHRLSSSG